VSVGVYYFIIFQESIEKSGLVDQNIN